MENQLYPSGPIADVQILRECLNKTLADMHMLIHHPDNVIPARFYDEEGNGDTAYGGQEKKSNNIPQPQRQEIRQQEKIKSAAVETYGQDTSYRAQPNRAQSNNALRWAPAELHSPTQSSTRPHAQMQSPQGKKKNPTTKTDRINAHFARLEKQFRLILSAQKAVAGQAQREAALATQDSETLATIKQSEIKSGTPGLTLSKNIAGNANQERDYRPCEKPPDLADEPDDPWRAAVAMRINPHKRE